MCIHLHTDATHNTMLCDEYTQFINTTRTSQKHQLQPQTCIIVYAILSVGILSVDVYDSIIDIKNIIEMHDTTY